jgi:hypothetical protein
MIDPCDTSTFCWFFIDPEDAAEAESSDPDAYKLLEGCAILTSDNPLWDDEVETNAAKGDDDAKAKDDEKKAERDAAARVRAASLTGGKPVLPEDDPA